MFLIVLASLAIGSYAVPVAGMAQDSPATMPETQVRAALSHYYHVISESLIPAKTTVDGDRATQSGTYKQSVRAPDGQTLDVSGGFEIEWLRDANAVWRIRRISTSPRR